MTTYFERFFSTEEKIAQHFASFKNTKDGYHLFIHISDGGLDIYKSLYAKTKEALFHQFFLWLIEEVEYE